MSWSEPKTDWGVDTVADTDFNRIEENTVTLHKGNGAATVPSVAIGSGADAGKFDIDDEHEVFVVSAYGASGISLILTENRQPGNKIFVISPGFQTTFLEGGSQSGSYYPLKVSAAVGTHQTAGDEVVCLVYYNNFWWVVGDLS